VQVSENDSQSQTTVQSVSKQKIVIKTDITKLKKKRTDVLHSVNGGSSVIGSTSVVGRHAEDIIDDPLSKRGPDKENNTPYDLQISANVEQSDGIRKEIPQVMENGNQVRSKYFPSSVTGSGARDGGPA